MNLIAAVAVGVLGSATSSLLENQSNGLAAGMILGSGTVSNHDAGVRHGRRVVEGGHGNSCIAELRMVETILKGNPETSFLIHGDEVRIWLNDAGGRSIFGAIDQTVKTAT